MTETKYGKYFVRGCKPGETTERFTHSVAYLDNSVIEGSFYFVFTFIRPDMEPLTHGPHTHDHAEILGHFGTNPDDPFDLGAEITLYMGEEMEKHTFNQSTLIYIPPKLVHCPIVYERVDRPFIFTYSMPTPVLQETSRKDLVPLVPEEIRSKLIFPYDD